MGINQHGYCPHCNADLDGDLIINYPRSQGYTEEQVQFYLKFYAADENSRWNRKIGIEYDRDRIEEWQCPDCNKKWGR